jgi:hypothetical protein
VKFKNWLLSEAKFDPRITQPEKFTNVHGEPYLSRSFAITLDKNGNVSDYDYETKKPYLEIFPKNKSGILGVNVWFWVQLERRMILFY